MYRRRARTVLDGVAVAAAAAHNAGCIPSIILACSEDETHSLALEALRAALGERDRGALMLGADVPTAALIDAIQRHDGPVTVLL